MRLATLDDGSPDGRLVVVSADSMHCAPAPVRTLQQALDQWDLWRPRLEEMHDFSETLEPARLKAPLPRAWQWLDGSTYASHAALMAQVFGHEAKGGDIPLMYQGLSDHFLGPFEDVPLPDESHGIDFEGEFAVITGSVAMGTPAAEARERIALVVLVNDWSLRNLAGREMKTGFGWVHAKPACSMASFAVTPDELGEAWKDCRVGLDLEVSWNDQWFGNPNGAAMSFGFDELIAHGATTRRLPAGTLIGSGTVSNPDYRKVGSTCIAERRGIEIVDEGKARTEYMRFGDRIRMRARTPQGASPFGEIDQRVVAAR
jgi:fumarylacetoacetate (FAA) hydrolase